MIEIDSAGLTLRRGPAGRPTVIPVSRITGVEIFNKLGRKVVNILTGGSVAKMLGITLISGPHVRIACDAFNGHEFEIFIQRIRALAG